MAFYLDKDKARAWLTEQQTAVDDGADYDLDIYQTWEPRDPGEEEKLALLVLLAQEREILTSDPPKWVDFVYEPDSDGGQYSVRVVLENKTESTYPLYIASFTQEMRKIGERDLLGIDAAVAVLAEVVELANWCLDRLHRFTARVAGGVIDQTYQAGYIDGKNAAAGILP